MYLTQAGIAINVALPVELNHAQKQSLVREFSRSKFVERGMVADVAYHDFQGQNSHAHILLTMREIDQKGFGKKNRRWNERGLLWQQRESWSQQANEALERAGYQEKIDHRSLADQGVERLPQIHLGPQGIEMEMRGIRTAIGDEMRRRSQINRRIKRWQQENEKLDTQIAQQRAQIEAQPTAIRFESDHQKFESPKQETEPTLETLPLTQPLAQQQAQLEGQATDISIERDRTEIESAESETEAALETPQPTHENSEDAPTVDRNDDEAERRRERYRQLSALQSWRQTHPPAAGSDRSKPITLRWL